MNPDPAQIQPAGVSLESGPYYSAPDVDRSCRAPVMFFFYKAAGWLAVAALLGFIASIKLHSGGFLAGSAWLTYGRLQGAALNVLAYGFACQAVFGIALWLLARLGNVPLHGGRGILLGGVLWNLGVALGVIGILAGHGTGYEWLEFPGYANLFLLLGYALIGLWALVTFCVRTRRELYVSQWFLLAGLLWFPWIWSTAQLLLFVWPVRGVMQAVVNYWYVHNFFGIWLTAGGLAGIFYLLPKLLDRPLFSHGLAMLAFWVLALFGTWGGIYAGTPFPKWLASVSIVGSFITTLALVAILAILWKTSTAHWAQIRSWAVLRFLAVGAGCFVTAKALGILGTFRSVSEVTHLTTYADAVRHLELYGFIGMTFAGTVYFLTPKLSQIEWPSLGLIRFHFWSALAGVTLVFLGFLAAGLRLGAGLNNPEPSALVLTRSLIPFLGLVTLGLLLIFVGYVAMLVNMGRLCRNWAAVCCRTEETETPTAAVGANV